MKTITLFSSSPTRADAAHFYDAAASMIKAKLEVCIDLDPRLPITVGDLVASCRNLELSFQRRAEHQLADGQRVGLFAVFGRDGDRPAVYLGNEVRLHDGRVVAQRLRSPESAVAFKNAATSAARHDKAANLFIANWRDEAVLDRETAKRLVVMAFPSDMTAGIAYRLSWYIKEHGAGPGRVDLRPALPALCAALDEADAKAKAEADAKATAKTEAAEAVAGEATVAELRAKAKALGLKGISKATKAELIAAIEAVVNPQPVRHEVTADQAKTIAVALNLIDVGDDGEIRLKRALREAGIKVPVVSGGAPGSFKAELVKAAKACVVVEAVEA